MQLVEHAAAQVDDASRAKLVHVMDREADNYALLSRMEAAGHRLVVRVNHDRQVLRGDEAPAKISVVMAGLATRVSRSVPLAAYNKPAFAASSWKSPRVQGTRIAALAMTAERVVLACPRVPPLTTKPLPPQVTLNLVHVHEVNAPAGQEPISWTLWSTDPIDTPAAIEHVVDCYVARWRIEEFFKAFKSGCELAIAAARIGRRDL